jgi:hypothetical protein
MSLQSSSMTFDFMQLKTAIFLIVYDIFVMEFIKIPCTAIG